MAYKPLLGLLLLAVPALFIWFALRKSKGVKAQEGNPLGGLPTGGAGSDGGGSSG